jgi:hypothetical protein
VIGIKEDGEEIRAPDFVGLRDQALIGAMFFTFARVVAMTVEDYFPQGKRSWLWRLMGRNRCRPASQAA